MKKNALGAFAAAAALAGTAAGAAAHPAATLASHARITVAQARRIALKKEPMGTIVSEELEKEKGGSGLRYSFDVKVGKALHEVGVDAVTGKVLEDSQATSD